MRLMETCNMGKNFFTLQVTTHWNRQSAQREVVSITGDIPEPSKILCHVLWDDPDYAGRLEQVTHCDSSQPDPFWDIQKQRLPDIHSRSKGNTTTSLLSSSSNLETWYSRLPPSPSAIQHPTKSRPCSSPGADPPISCCSSTHRALSLLNRIYNPAITEHGGEDGSCIDLQSPHGWNAAQTNQWHI